MATDSVRWLQPDHQQLRRLNGELDSGITATFHGGKLGVTVDVGYGEESHDDEINPRVSIHQVRISSSKKYHVVLPLSRSSQILNKNATSDADACALPPPLVCLLPPFYILLLFLCLFVFTA